MKLKQMIFWQSKASLTAFITFYSVLILISILGCILMATFPEEITFQMAAASITFVFLFIVGLSSFSENLRFACANGVSRRTHFLSFLLFAIVIAAVTALLSFLIDTVLGLFSNVNHIIHLEPFYNPFSLLFPLNLFLLSIGYFISGAYYRMNKNGKTIVSILVPIGIIVLLVNVVMASPGALFYPAQQFFLNLSNWLIDNKNMFLFFSTLSAVIFLFGWLITRKAPIKPQNSMNG